MLISPPFLPQRNANQSDEAWLDAAMRQPAGRLANTGAPEGSYPVSNQFAWHNGLHLQGQPGTDGHTAVRAIADGVVIYVAQPKESNTSPADPQNYNPFADSPAWTDNGCIIIRHTTEIGANDGQPTEIIYFSLVTHLCQIARITPTGQTSPRTLQAGDRVWRKDEIGRAGQIYGHSGQIHVEICLDDANLTRLIGRRPAWFAPDNIPVPAADGRIDAVFGSIWFYLPASTPTSATRPQTHQRTITQSTLGEPLWLQMAYDQGHCSFTSHSAIGHSFAQPRQDNVEYDLYSEAHRRHSSLPQAVRARSSPSGWYELLRFGRNLGRGPAQTDKDPLPADVAHWREIPGPNGQSIWADLNAEGTYKFSDADFLPICGWNFVDDDTSPDDQRCDSDSLKNLVADSDTQLPGRLETANLTLRLGDVNVAQKLRRLVCRFPSELDQATINSRYAFVREIQPFVENPDAWAHFESHLNAITFAALPPEYTSATWRLHPGEFISLLRKCAWLSRSELQQLVPSHAIRTGTYRDHQGRERAGVFWEATPAATLINGHRQPLNRMLRKYGVNTPLRQAGFFGNSVQETTWLRTLTEGGGAGYWYAPWYGRGFLQLTHPENYIGYWRWRGRIVPAALEQALNAASQTANVSRSNAGLQDAQFPALTPEMRTWRQNIEGQPEPSTGEALNSASDSAGYYWLKTDMARFSDEPNTQILERQVVATINTQGRSMGNHTYYRSQGFWRVSAAVNLPARINDTNYTGLNGFDSRCSAYGVALAVLTEQFFPDAQGQATLLYPEGYVRGARR